MQKGAMTAIFLAIIVSISGCATAPPGERNVDPFETVNRGFFQFNRDFDRAFLEPVADAYVEVTPRPIRTSISNFFDNLGYLNVILNDFLQGKAKEGFWDTSRFVLNSTVGLAGLFDVATPIGLEPSNEDFGQTLGRWGLDSGPYLVLPFLGSSTVRDGTGLVADYALDPLREVDDDDTRVGLYTLDVISTRAELLEAGDILDEAAMDPYIFMREAYLQRRKNRVHDGNPPVEVGDEVDIFSDD
jgi:phospholipid-binding lipoprotein MlaA